MEISKASVAAIRGLAYLADAQDQAPLDVKEIAGGLGMPQGYLAKIFQTLSKNHLAYSRRGPKGGYVLARKPEAISLLDIIEAVDGPVLSSQCIFPPGEHCRMFDRCKIREQLEALKEQTRELYNSVTLDSFSDQFSKN